MHVVCMQLNLSTIIHINISKMKETIFMFSFVSFWKATNTIKTSHTSTKNLCFMYWKIEMD